MFKPNVKSATVVLASLFATTAAWAADTNSQTFLTNAIQGNLAEISVGQLAVQRGTTDKVKQVGQTLVDDHSKANQKAMEVAKTLGITAPTEPNAEQKEMHDKLAAESGATFDNDFAVGMVADHKKDITDYQQAALNDKDAVGQYAQETLPDLQKHLGMLQGISGGKSDMVGTMTPASSTTATAGSVQNGNVPPFEGANSFTEGEAKSHIEKAGFSSVSALKKDDHGIWRGTASKNGQTTPIALDFKGNVVAK